MKDSGPSFLYLLVKLCANGCVTQNPTITQPNGCDAKKTSAGAWNEDNFVSLSFAECCECNNNNLFILNAYWLTHSLSLTLYKVTGSQESIQGNLGQDAGYTLAGLQDTVSAVIHANYVCWMCVC